MNELEAFTILEQLALMQDEIEQDHQIDMVQQLLLKEKQQQCENYEKSLEFEQYHGPIEDEIEQIR